MNDPVIPGFHPDPSICRAGETYYTAHSSFEYAPGVPIFRSTDLVRWELVGNALTRQSQLPVTAGAASSGIYAPTLRFREGRFWLVTTNIGEFRRGHLLLSAEDPAGPWSEAVHIPGTLGIDPDLMWDDEGVCRLTWASFDPARPGIVSAPIDLEQGVLLAEPQPLWQGTGLQSPEGPHLYRIDGWWYLLLAEGGTERGHTVTMARARTLEGPWESPPVNPVLTHRSTDHPVQNVGHADLIELLDGSWAMVYHGVRPRGQTPHFHVNGRETFLAGVDWVDGWPVIDEERFRVEARDHSFVDRFEEGDLHPRWVGPGASPAVFATPAPGGLLLQAGHTPEGGSALLATRIRDEQWTFRARLGPTEGIGRVVVRIDSSHWYGLTLTAEEVRATVAVGAAVSTLGRMPRAAGADVDVRISARLAVSGRLGRPDEPDLIELAASGPDGAELVFGSVDGRYLATEVAGGFTGRVVGVEVVEGTALVREVEYRSGREAPAAGAGGGRYDIDAVTFETLLEDPDSRAVLDELVPELPVHPFVEHMKHMPLVAILQAGNAVAPDVADELRTRLAALPPH